MYLQELRSATNIGWTMVVVYMCYPKHYKYVTNNNSEHS
jgi:hypothetical protein